MKRSTFILIVCIYGFLLGLAMVLATKSTVAFFGGDPENFHEVSIMRFFGILHLGFNFVALSIRNSLDTKVVKAFLLAIAFVLFASLSNGLYNVFGMGLAQNQSFWFDNALWALLGLGSIYFYSKE